MSSYSKKILKKLSEKSALPVDFLKSDDTKVSYATTRALKNLVDQGFAEIHDSGQKNYARITPRGKIKLNSISLESGEALIPTIWDGFWRIILLDLPESRKSERESLRYLLKKAGFVCLKNSAWISPYPFEHLFGNIKKDLGLTTEIMIVVTQYIDEETKKVLLETFGK